MFLQELKFDHVPRGHLLLAASLLEPSVSASLRRLPSAALVRLLRRYASYIKEDDVVSTFASRLAFRAPDAQYLSGVSL